MTDTQKYPVPPVPDLAGLDPPVRAALEPIVTILRAREGQTEHELEQVVTQRDLYLLGLVGVQGDDGAVAYRDPNAPTPIGERTPRIRARPSPEPDYTPPPAPTHLQAFQGPTKVVLSWDDVSGTVSNFGYTEVWRAESPNLSDAVKVGATSAYIYGETVGNVGTTYYYWVRHATNTNPTVFGPFNDALGTPAQQGLVESVHIANAAILEAHIADASVTNAKIGNEIKSTNFVAGTSGWRITKDGTADFSTGIFRDQLDAPYGTLGALSIDTTGYIAGGQTAYNTGAGFWLGYHSTTYKLSIGNGSGSYMTWDGSALTIQASGGAKITAGTSLTIESTSGAKITMGTNLEIKDQNNNVILSAGTGAGDHALAMPYNLLYNPGFKWQTSAGAGTVAPRGWTFAQSHGTYSGGMVGTSWYGVGLTPLNQEAGAIGAWGGYTNTTNHSSGGTPGYALIYSNKWPVIPGDWYEVSAYAARANISGEQIGFADIEWLDASGAAIAWSGTSQITQADNALGNTGDLTSWKRIWGIVQAPAGARQARARLVSFYCVAGAGIRFTMPLCRKASLLQTTPSPWTEGVNFPGGLDASNIGTYMASAAIGTAYIADANVTTLKLAGQAVTIPVSTSASSLTSLNGTPTSYLSSSITSTGAPISVLMSAYVSKTHTCSVGQAGTTTVYARIVRESTVIFDGAIGSVSADASGNFAGDAVTEPEAATIQIQDQPGAGTFTYYLHLWHGVSGTGSASSSVSTRSLTLLETKR